MAGTVLQFAGVLIIGATAAQLTLLLIGSLSRHAHERQRRALRREWLRNEVDAATARRRVHEEQARFAWDGYRKFNVQRKVEEASGIVSFYLAAHDRGPLPPYEPGQFLTFRLRIPGQSRPTIRCYSLSDCYRPGATDQLRISVKKVPAPADQPDAPPGLASHFLHETVREGDILDVKAPSGKFVLDESREHPAVLIGGGVGITPLLSMINAVAHSQSPREVWLLYGVRNRTEHAWADHLAALDRDIPNVHVRIFYSDPTPDDVEGRDFHFAGRITIDRMRDILGSSNYDFYICGPPPMMTALRSGLAEWGVPKQRLHFEAFGPASVNRTEKPVAEKSVTITFSQSKKTLPWKSADGALLEFAERQGISIESGCRAGDCGTCLVAVRKGAVEYMKEPGFACEQGTCLTCIATPTSDLELDA